MPAASPSRPSTKFMALTISTTMKTVTITLVRGSRTNTPPMGSQATEMPPNAMMPAASVWPANFVSASRPQRSSTIPTPTRTVMLASRAAAVPVGPWKTVFIRGSWLAKTNAATSPK